MRAIPSFYRLTAVAVSLVLVAGCDLLTDHENPPVDPPTDWEATTDLNSAYGGYTFTDEAADFGDAEMKAVVDAEVAELPAAEADTIPEPHAVAVRIVWGQLELNPEATEVIDWSGSLSVDAGRLAGLRKLAFEGPQDHLVRPRPDPRTIVFVSRTRPSFDGLLVLVHAHPDSAQPTSITLQTGPLTHTWMLADLDSTPMVMPVDGAGNAVAITLLPLGNQECAQGFVRGMWVRRQAERGVLYAAWVGDLGRPHGVLRGHWGVDSTGTRVWFAKIIGPHGQLIGLARGNWEPSSDPQTPGGTFAGRFAARAGGPEGEITGRYIPGPEGRRRGFLEARWRADCSSGEVLPQ